MKVTSFYREGLQLKPMEVEVRLTPGLPVLKILGLPDAMTKECAERVKVALKSQNFKWPRAKQVVVQLRPGHIKKKSLGLDLAIAAALIWESEQLPKPLDAAKLYGILTLDGDVCAPEDLDEILGEEKIYSGWLSEGHPFDVMALNCLRDLECPTLLLKSSTVEKGERPSLAPLKFPPELARCMEIVAAGEHPALFAGPAGSGKTTSVRFIHSLLRDPEGTTLRQSQMIARQSGQRVGWRPLVTPHHGASTNGVIGGGNPPVPGDITRAHGGVLLLDEYLQFDSVVQEALREPVEQGCITVSRARNAVKFPADFLLLATTNFCKCGKFVPSSESACACNWKLRARYMERLSGPMLDRFSILYFTKPWTPAAVTVGSAKIFENVQRAIEFAVKCGRVVPNSRLDSVRLRSDMSPFVKKELVPVSMDSARREQSLLRVARTLADLSESELIQAGHLKEATDLCVTPFRQLEASSQDMDPLRQFR